VRRAWNKGGKSEEETYNNERIAGDVKVGGSNTLDRGNSREESDGKECGVHGSTIGFVA
jgi:hypothetical protein